MSALNSGGTGPPSEEISFKTLEDGKYIYPYLKLIIMTLFRCHVIYLAGQRPTNWGHYFYHSKVDGDRHDRQIQTQTQIFLRGLTVKRPFPGRRESLTICSC